MVSSVAGLVSSLLSHVRRVLWSVTSFPNSFPSILLALPFQNAENQFQHHSFYFQSTGNVDEPTIHFSLGHGSPPPVLVTASPSMAPSPLVPATAPVPAVASPPMAPPAPLLFEHPAASKCRASNGSLGGALTCCAKGCWCSDLLRTYSNSYRVQLISSTDSKSFYNTEKWQARPNAYLEQVNLCRKIKIKIYRII
jgi:hypothetical protein